MKFEFDVDNAIVLIIILLVIILFFVCSIYFRVGKNKKKKKYNPGGNQDSNNNNNNDDSGVFNFDNRGFENGFGFGRGGSSGFDFPSCKVIEEEEEKEE